MVLDPGEWVKRKSFEGGKARGVKTLQGEGDFPKQTLIFFKCGSLIAGVSQIFFIHNGFSFLK